MVTIVSGEDGSVIGVPVTDLGRGHQLIGKLHQPLGTVVRIQGVVVEGPMKGFEGGPNIRVQRIDGRATQEDIQIHLKDATNAVQPDEFTNVKLKIGETYELQGFESGGFLGHPIDIWKSDTKEFKGAWIQTTNHYFAIRFHYVRGKSIAAVKDSPDDFIGRRALLAGVARDQDGQAIMEGNGWIVIVIPNLLGRKEYLASKSKQQECTILEKPISTIRKRLIDFHWWMGRGGRSSWKTSWGKWSNYEVWVRTTTT